MGYLAIQSWFNKCCLAKRVKPTLNRLLSHVMLTHWSDTRKNGFFFFTFLKNFSKVILLLDHDLKTLAPFPSCERNKNDISGRI